MAWKIHPSQLGQVTNWYAVYAVATIVATAFF